MQTLFLALVLCAEPTEPPPLPRLPAVKVMELAACLTEATVRQHPQALDLSQRSIAERRQFTLDTYRWFYSRLSGVPIGPASPAAGPRKFRDGLTLCAEPAPTQAPVVSETVTQSYPQLVAGRFGVVIVAQATVQGTDFAGATTKAIAAAQTACVAFGGAHWVNGAAIDPASLSVKPVCPGGGKPCYVTCQITAWEQLKK